MAEVSARKRGSKWEYRFEVASIRGKRKQFSKGGFSTKKEAVKAGTEAFAKYNRSGMLFEPADMSFSDYLDFWLENYCHKQLSFNSWLGYSSATESVIRPQLGKLKLASITPTVILEWQNWLADKGYTEGTIKYYKSVLSCALRYAVRPLEYIERNPASNLGMPKVTVHKDDREILTPSQFEEVTGLLGNDKRAEKLAMNLSFNAGLRAGEAVSLTWDDVDLENRIIRIRKQIIDNRVSSLKTRTSVRDVPIGATLVALLEEEKKRQEKDRIEYGDLYTDYCLDGSVVRECVQGEHESFDIVCRRENGKRINPMILNRVCYNLAKQSGIHFTFHMLRHSHATLLAIGNAPVKAIQERLGHSSASITMNIYMHNTKEQSRLASDIFERLVHAK